jgi:hypothetical protein
VDRGERSALTSAEIESVLLAHPKVADAAAFGIPHPDWGEEVKAVIQPVEGEPGDDRLRAEILAFCADQLARYKTPRTIDFIAEMPRDSNGKLYKRKLRDPHGPGASGGASEASELAQKGGGALPRRRAEMRRAGVARWLGGSGDPARRAEKRPP